MKKELRQQGGNGPVFRSSKGRPKNPRQADSLPNLHSRGENSEPCLTGRELAVVKRICESASLPVLPRKALLSASEHPRTRKLVGPPTVLSLPAAASEIPREGRQVLQRMVGTFKGQRRQEYEQWRKKTWDRAVGHRHKLRDAAAGFLKTLVTATVGVCFRYWGKETADARVRRARDLEAQATAARERRRRWRKGAKMLLPILREPILRAQAPVVKLLRQHAENCKILDMCDKRQVESTEEDLHFHLTNMFSEEELLPQHEIEIRRLARRYGIHLVELDKLKKLFDSIDRDASGKLDEGEFREVLYNLLKVEDKYDFPESRFRQLWMSIDTDKTGTINFVKFLGWWKLFAPAIAPPEVMEKFQ
mmetsp:Transcript_41591/g.90665  ORF Transcript_41591/g.90665 Transcript_41591/m.90665 type:complete len:363 (-) Transcript_41591:121-1209(-)